MGVTGMVHHIVAVHGLEPVVLLKRHCLLDHGEVVLSLIQSQLSEKVILHLLSNVCPTMENVFLHYY